MTCISTARSRLWIGALLVVGTGCAAPSRVPTQTPDTHSMINAVPGIVGIRETHVDRRAIVVVDGQILGSLGALPTSSTGVPKDTKGVACVLLLKPRAAVEQFGVRAEYGAVVIRSRGAVQNAPNNGLQGRRTVDDFSSSGSGAYSAPLNLAG